MPRVERCPPLDLKYRYFGPPLPHPLLSPPRSFSSAIFARFVLSLRRSTAEFSSYLFRSFSFARPHPWLSFSPSFSHSLYISPSCPFSFCPSSSSNFSFSLSRRNSRFPALSKINTSQRGLKTCVNMVLHCLYVHITLSAPGYLPPHRTPPATSLTLPRLFVSW